MRRSLSLLLLGLAVLAIGPAFADVTVDLDQSQTAYTDQIDRPEVAAPSVTVVYVVHHDPAPAVDNDAVPAGPVPVAAAVATESNLAESRPAALRPPVRLAGFTRADGLDAHLHPLRRPPDIAAS